MECLLIGGAQSVGKSESIYRLANYIISQGFTDVFNSVPVTFNDFNAILERTDPKGKLVRIIINSPTDTPEIIQKFKDFYDNNGRYDILISSIRDNIPGPRNDFFRIMGINSALEIPLAKITRRDNNKNLGLKWYQDKVDALLIHTLKNSPFLI